MGTVDLAWGTPGVTGVLGAALERGWEDGGSRKSVTQNQSVSHVPPLGMQRPIRAEEALVWEQEKHRKLSNRAETLAGRLSGEEDSALMVRTR